MSVQEQECDTDNCAFEEYADAETQGYPYWSTYNYIWGIYTTWHVILGVLILTWYPNMVRYNTWLSMMCPTVAWTATTLTASTNPATTGTAALTEGILNGWDTESCLKATPIRTWTMAAWN